MVRTLSRSDDDKRYVEIDMNTPTVSQLEKELSEIEVKLGKGSLQARFESLLTEMGVHWGRYASSASNEVMFIPTSFNGDTGKNLLGIVFRFSSSGDKLAHIVAFVGDKANRERLLEKFKNEARKARS
jgi:hypothetical protein